MESYIYLTKSIINFYDFFLQRAKEVQNYPGANSECRAAAENMIVNFKTNPELFQYVDELSEVYTHLGFLRKSFYCAICSVENQQYFNIKAKKITFANKFCHNTVISTIELFHTRNSVIMGIFNNMSLLHDCDPNETYVEDPYKVDMKLDQLDEIALNKCHDIFQKDNDPRVFMEDCTDFCAGYSMTKATELYEGNFGKLNYLFNKLTAVTLFRFSRFLDLHMFGYLAI